MFQARLVFGDLVINYDARRVVYNQRMIPLSKLEFDLLYYLAQRANQVCPYDVLLNEVWEYDPEQGTPFVVHLTLHRLRKRFKQYTSVKNLPAIRAVRGVGLCFDWYPHSKLKAN